ncbi:protein kinase domain-containing protein [Streptosporangium sp. NPDC004631]
MASGTEDLLIKGRYRLLSRLGEGGMGNVWLADDAMLGRRVALKELVLSPQGEHLSVRRERALREARAAASIGHPGIVDIYDVFLEEGRPWIVMAYIRGRSLLELVEGGGLGERELARIGVRVLDALTAAHRASVLHRDIKPANIVISETGRVFLVDFGIAQIGGHSSLTIQNTFTGTPEFMAPERIYGRTPGPPSDLWSLGVTFFYALEGYSPFRRDSAIATMRAVTDHAPPPASRPGPLSDAVIRLLEKDPARRMGAHELALVLKSVAAAPSRRPPPEPTPRTRLLPTPRAVPPPVPASRTAPPPVSPPAPRATPPPASRAVPPPPSGTAPPPVSPPAPRATPPPASRAVPPPPSGTTPPPVSPRVSRGVPPAAPGGAEPSESPNAGDLDPAEVARLVGGMAAEPAARFFATLPPKTAQQVLTRLEPRVAAGILLALPGSGAASVLTAIPARTVGGLLEKMADRPQKAASVLQMLSAARAGRVVDHMRLDEVSALLDVTPPGEAVRILAHAHVRTAAGVVGALSVPQAARLVGAMPVRRACDTLGYIPPATIAALLRTLPDDRAERLLDGLDQRARAHVLRYLNGS